MEKTRHHIVLLGDSVFDNGAYIGAETYGMPPVRKQLYDAVVHRGWDVTLCAVDGAKIEDVAAQVANLPEDATLLVLSVGGNDGLQYLPRLVHDGLCNLYSNVNGFLKQFVLDYVAMLGKILDKRLPIVVATIYCPWFSGIQYALVARAVSWINDEIRKIAKAFNLPLLDLWTVFDRAEDFANPIEPGVPGGHKIVRNLVAMIDSHAIETGYSEWAINTYADGYKPTGLPYWSADRFKAGGRFRIDTYKLDMR